MLLARVNTLFTRYAIYIDVRWRRGTAILVQEGWIDGLLLKMTLCTACGANIECKKNRCSLSEDTLVILTELTADTGSGLRHDPSAYICKKCKLRLQRLHHLKKQVSELQQSIITTLSCSVQVHSSSDQVDTDTADKTAPPATPPAVPSESPRGRKRSSEQAGSNTHKRRRLVLREIESQPTVQSSSTPDVAVSGCINIHTWHIVSLLFLHVM